MSSALKVKVTTLYMLEVSTSDPARVYGNAFPLLAEAMAEAQKHLDSLPPSVEAVVIAEALEAKLLQREGSDEVMSHAAKVHFNHCERAAAKCYPDLYRGGSADDTLNISWGVPDRFDTNVLRIAEHAMRPVASMEAQAQAIRTGSA